MCLFTSVYSYPRQVGVTPLPGGYEGFADVYKSGQRCLVFSHGLPLLDSIVNDEWGERIQQECSVALSRVGLSLVDDTVGREVMYAAITR